MVYIYTYFQLYSPVLRENELRRRKGVHASRVHPSFQGPQFIKHFAKVTVCIGFLPNSVDILQKDQFWSNCGDDLQRSVECRNTTGAGVLPFHCVPIVSKFDVQPTVTFARKSALQ